MGRWRSRSWAVRMPSCSRAPARCGPTPFTYWTDAWRSMAARRSSHEGRKGRVLEIHDRSPGLEADSPHREGQGEGGSEVESLGVRGAPGRAADELAHEGRGHGPAPEARFLEVDRAHSVPALQSARDLDGHDAGEEAVETPGSLARALQGDAVEVHPGPGDESVVGELHRHVRNPGRQAPPPGQVEVR